MEAGMPILPNIIHFLPFAVNLVPRGGEEGEGDEITLK
jgi:hypothetical protein